MTVVAHFIDSMDPGGAETVVVDLCRTLGVRGYRTHILHFGNHWLADKCVQAGVEQRIVPDYQNYKSVRTLPVFTWRFARYLRETQVDILHSHLLGATTGASLATMISGTPHIGTLHDFYSLEEGRRYPLLLRFAASFNTRLVAVSRQIMRHLCTVEGLPAYAISVIGNGTDTGTFRPQDKSPLRRQLSLSEDDFLFICVARFVPLKRHDLLIESFSRLPDNPRAKLLLVGDGPCLDAMKTAVREKSLDDRVVFMGRRGDIPALLAASDCFVLSSDTEGLSCSVLEAMSSGLPVIATDVGGNRDLVAQGESGYLITRQSTNEFAARMTELAGDPALCRRMGDRSRAIVEARYTLDTMSSNYASCYKLLLASRRKQRPLAGDPPGQNVKDITQPK